jgi:hypothetical protein
MAGRKSRAHQVDDEPEKEGLEMGGDEVDEEEFADAEEEAEDEESGAGDNDDEEDAPLQLSSQHPVQTPQSSYLAAARRTMMAVPLDMSLWKTVWTLVVRPPHLSLFKKSTAATGKDVLEAVGAIQYVAVTKRAEPGGKNVPVINFWARKAGVTTRYGVTRRLFLAQEVRDPNARITAGKFKSAPDAVSFLSSLLFQMCSACESRVPRSLCSPCESETIVGSCCFVLCGRRDVARSLRCHACTSLFIIMRFWGSIASRDH